MAAGLTAMVLVVGERAPGAPPPPASYHPAPAGRPNIVFVLTDDLTWDLVPYMPHVRELQRDGMTFRQFLVSDSLCCSSRATIFTGEFPHNTGVLGNEAPTGGYEAFRRNGDTARSVAVALQGAGYRTALWGKYLNEYQPIAPGRDPGWDEWFAVNSAYRGFGYRASDGGFPRYLGYRPRDYLTAVLLRRAVRFIRANAAQRQPFFGMVSTFAPHKPAVAAPRDRGRFRHLPLPRDPAYDAQNAQPPGWLGRRPPLTRAQHRRLVREFRERVRSVQAVDRMIGRIRATLRATGLTRNTYFVFTSDNGFHLGQHRLMAGKRTAFDQDIRVPLIVAGPGVPPGSATSRVTGTVDLAPTFEHWAGLGVDRSRDGRSLTPLLDGRLSRWQRALLIEHTTDTSRRSDPDAQGWAGGRPSTYAALRTRWTTYVEYANGEREFYDRRSDPAELHNVVGRLSPLRLARLSAALERYRRCRGLRECRAAAAGAAPVR